MDHEEDFHDCLEEPITVNGDGEVISEEVSASGERKDSSSFLDNIRKEVNSDAGTEAKSLLEREKNQWGDEDNEEPMPTDDDNRYLHLEKDLSKALEAKEEGNRLFREKDYDNAIQYYSQAIGHCPNTTECKEQLATFYGNRAAAYLAEEEYELVIEDCSESLKLKEDYTKVLVRRMQCYDKLEKWEEALAGKCTMSFQVFV
jgi:tetratricopeptide (TPR) repeat protein